MYWFLHQLIESVHVSLDFDVAIVYLLNITWLLSVVLKFICKTSCFNAKESKCRFVFPSLYTSSIGSLFLLFFISLLYVNLRGRL